MLELLSINLNGINISYQQKDDHWKLRIDSPTGFCEANLDNIQFEDFYDLLNIMRQYRARQGTVKTTELPI